MASTLVADTSSEGARTAVKDAIEWNGGRLLEDTAARVIGEFDDAATAFAAAADAQRGLDNAGEKAALRVDTGGEAVAPAKKVMRPALAIFIAADLVIAGLVIFYLTSQS